MFGLGNRQYEHFNKVWNELKFISKFYFHVTLAFGALHLLINSLVSCWIVFDLYIIFPVLNQVAVVVDDVLTEQGMHHLFFLLLLTFFLSDGSHVGVGPCGF